MKVWVEVNRWGDVVEMKRLDVLGPQEIATLLGVKHGTVKTWRYRGVLPEPEAVVSGVPIWRRSTIEKWARETGRKQ